MRNAQSTPSSRYYRSVKYKINTSSVVDNPNPRHLTPAKVNKTHTIAWHKPSAYSTASHLQNKLKSNSVTAGFESTARAPPFPAKDVGNPEGSFTKISYLSTWDSLLHPELNKIHKLREEE